LKMFKIGAGNMLKIGIMGLGDISAIHLNTIEANSNVALVAACDIDNAMQTKVPNAQFFTNFENMLKRSGSRLCTYLFASSFTCICDNCLCRKRYTCFARKTSIN